MARPDHVEINTSATSPPARPGRRAPLKALLNARPRVRAAGNDNYHCELNRGAAQELDCLRGVLAPDVLRRAEIRARELWIGADQVLIRLGLISEAAYLRRLSRHTGIAIDDLWDYGRQDILLRDDQIAYSAASGMVYLYKDGKRIVAVTPRHYAARGLCRAGPSIKNDMRLTSDYALRRLLLQQSAPALIEQATRGLATRHPALSAAPIKAAGGPWLGRFRRGAAVLAVMLLPPIFIPGIWGAFLACWFLAFAALRLACCTYPQRHHAVQRIPDHRLPSYSVMVALYHEASSVAPLVRALEALDYPREKLEIVLVVEPDDLHTRAAIARLGDKPHLQTRIAPAAGPQTKPKALNWALPFARGTFLAVYDAEDRPDPGQLRAALQAFAAHGDDVACAQASLCIDNETHSLLSRMFAVEYAGHFDVMLPGMTAMNLPLPLGGSSNHFRTSILRKVGAWDAYNVTEDADLGFRLARFGYRSVAFASTTFEEAPIRLNAWLKQRSRWLKGWLQTWCVHMRDPLQLWRDARAGGFMALNIVAGGNVLTALVYPFMLYAVLNFLLLGGSGQPLDWADILHISAFAAGCIASAVLGMVGLTRRNRLRDGWILGLTALYWLCLSAAAWRAVWQFVWKPYHWEKTEHGVVKRGDRAPPSPSEQASRQRAYK